MPGSFGLRRGAGDRQRTQLAGLDVRQHSGHRIGDHLDLARYDGREHGRGAAIGHVHDVDAGVELEHLEKEMRRDAEAL